MSPRERNLLIALIAVVGCGVLLYGGKRWFLDPLRDYNTAIQTITAENEILEGQLNTFNKERKKLTLARLKSLPANREQAAAEYIAYLHPLLDHSGLEVDEVKPSPAQEVKPVTPTPEIKKTGHLVMTFTVRAKGELGHLVAAMERMQETPFEHRIKNLTIDRTDMTLGKSASGRLTITMIVETLLVAKTESKPGLPPGIDPKYLVYDVFASFDGATPIGWGVLASMAQLKLAMPTPANRDYEDIAKKNIFVGAIPYEPPPKPPVIVKEEKPEPVVPEITPDVNVPAYVRLIHTVPDQQIAYLRNFVYAKAEMKLENRERSGYDTFRIIDDDTGYVFFKAKVLRVELRAVYFQVKDDVYKLQMGQTLADAMESPLMEARVDLEDDGLYDREWAEEEKAADKKKNSTKKKGTTKGGR